MPPRLSRGSLPKAASKSSSQKNNKKSKQRGLNAFAIASAENPESYRGAKHRLGEFEDNGPRHKKRRTGEEEDDDAEDVDMGSEGENGEGTRPARGNSRRGEDLDIDSGSDSEGNHWRMGEAGSDDSDIDSDEAFGESDEERFDGFTFRGGSERSTKKKRSATNKKISKVADGEVNLDESDDDDLEEEDESDGSDDSLGSDAVDLATMLDDEPSDSDADDDDASSSSSKHIKNVVKTTPKSMRKSIASQTPESDFSDEERGSYTSDQGSDPVEWSEEDDDDDEISEDEDEGTGDAKQLQQLQRLIKSMPTAHDENDADDDDAADPENSAARLLSALKNMPNLDPAFKSSLKQLSQTADPSRRERAKNIVKAPLPKRQQDKIDRVAAYSKATDTLNRWLDTIKHNRRAEHLSFPLKDPDAQAGQGADNISSLDIAKPQTELENAINTILLESGFRTDNQRALEEDILNNETQAVNKLSPEEAQERLAKLRRSRELMFREEKRAKRIKKIKSKAYRRIHRREKEKISLNERDRLHATGDLDSEAEREEMDRRRAQERMGARHRDSKWAKNIKKTGRTAWDDDVRADVTENARRNEELRRRAQGEKPSRQDGDESDSESSFDSADDDGEFRTREELDDVKKDNLETGRVSNIASMKFMQRAEAERKRQNDEAIHDLERDMRGSSAEDEAIGNEEQLDGRQVGRRIFGASETQQTVKQSAVERNELEEGSASDDDGGSVTFKLTENEKPARTKSQSSRDAKTRSNAQTVSKEFKLHPPAQVKVVGEQQVSRQETEAHDAQDSIRPADIVRKNRPSQDMSNWKTVELRGNISAKEDQNDSEEEDEAAITISRAHLKAVAFGGDDVEEQFAEEKTAVVKEDGDQIVDNSLPGWGSWAGDGVSKSEQKRINKNNKRFTTKVQGIKPSDRKDAKLDRAIISEKRIKKNAKYLAPSLPHSYESKAQYERSLRIPIGPEWTTKESFQKATKPRVMIKQGIITPMSKPMI